MIKTARRQKCVHDQQYISSQRNIYICPQSAYDKKKASDVSNPVFLHKLSKKRTTQGFLCLPRYDTWTSCDASMLSRQKLQAQAIQPFPARYSQWLPTQAKQPSLIRHHILTSTR